MKEKALESILVLFIGLVAVVIAAFLVSKIGNFNKGEKAIVPDVETFIATSTEPELTRINLIKEPYSPLADIYSNPASYKKYAITLALKGEFTTSELIVKGIVKNSLQNFLSISVNSIGGTFGASRKSADTLDLQNTTAVFDKEHPINLTINLKGPVKLSTTKNEFLSTAQPSKSVVLWDYIKPPPNKGTVARIVIAPYSERGIYGDGGTITDVEFAYVCEEGSDCKVEVCEMENYTYGSECLREVFGADAAKAYSDYFTR